MMTFCALAVFMAAIPAVGAERKQVEAIRFDQAPVIDGRVDEAAWQTGAWHEGFTLIRSAEGAAGGEPAPVATRFKVGIDDQTLYLTVQLDQPAGVPLVINHLERDGRVWLDDAIEFMINPNPTVDRYVHVIVNAGGAVFDSIRVEDGLLADRAFDSAVETAVQIEDDRWTVELAVPLADLGLTGDETDTWTFNVARSSHATGKHIWSSFAFIDGETLHQPPKFARLKVGKVDTTPFLWTIQPTGTSLVSMNDGQLMLETAIRVRNQTGSYQFFELDVNLVQDEQVVGAATFHRGLDTGAERIYTLAIPYEGEGNAQVSVTLKSAETGAKWRRQQYAAALDYTPIEIRLTEPGYRDTIYATQDLDAIAGEVSLNLTREVLGAYRLDVALHSPAGEPLASTTVETLEPRVTFELPIPDDMPAGRYQVVTHLTSNAGGKDYQEQRSLTKLPPPAQGREVRLGTNRALYVDGKPMVPYGAFTVRPHDDLEYVAAQGYNIVGAYRFHAMTYEAGEAWLDRLHENGMMATFSPLRGVSRNPNQLFTPEEEQTIREYVQRWSKHPALLAWYLDDEPELRSTLPARLQQLYRIVSEADPYHPTIILNNSFDGVFTYGEYTDILMPDPYPGFYKKGGTRRRIDFVYHFIRTAEQAFDHGRAAWATPQAFSWADWHAGRQDEREPNLIELRNMYHQVIHAKGTGWVWYTYMTSRGYPNIRIGLGFLARETQLLRDVILATDKAQPLRSNLEERELLAHHREVDGHHYLFVTNLVNEPKELRLALPKGAPGQWHVLSEGRTVSTTGGTLVETLEPFASHIYTTDESLANQLNLQEALQRISKARTWKSVKELDGPHPPLPADEVEFTRKHGW